MMQAVTDAVDTMFDVFKAPQSFGLLERVGWSTLVIILFLGLGLVFGQAVLGRGPAAFYPRERFTIALAWSILVFQFFLAAMTAYGWWNSTGLTLGALSLHIAYILAGLLVVLLCLPAVPRQKR
jgi:hypothetical protein